MPILDRLLITGGYPLEGTVSVSGAKNAALPILASTLLSDAECIVANLPRVRDVAMMNMLLSLLGVTVKADGDRVAIRASSLCSTEAPYDLVKTMRASILVLGPLLARFGEATVSLPGGCAIGTRPVDLHLQGLAKLGAEIHLEHGYIRARANRLQGACIDLNVPTVTGTENLLMAACLAQGTTTIRHAAQEPEIVDLAEFLVKRGARIHGAGSEVVTIQGVTKLFGAEHEVIADRIEAGTYLMAGAITGGDVSVDRCNPLHLQSVLHQLQEGGAEVTQGRDTVRLKPSRRLKSLDIETVPYPGFPTDLQAQMMALMCVAEGTSVITETVFESRFLHVPELRRMGAAIRIDGARAVVKGPTHLTGAPVMASDLRASAGLVLAGLAAEGESEVSRIYHLERGYERIEDKLQGLGAMIRRVPAAA